MVLGNTEEYQDADALRSITENAHTDIRRRNEPHGIRTGFNNQRIENRGMHSGSIGAF
jgi:hypothetical protein